MPQLLDAALLASVAEHTSNLVVITDAAGLTVWVNDAFCRLSGYTPDELIGRPPGQRLQGPATDGAAAARLGAAVRGGQALQGEVILNYRRDGTPYWLSIDLNPVHDAAGVLTHFVAIQTDVTLRLLQQREIETLQRRLALALDAADFGVWESAAPFDTVWLDGNAERLLGWPGASATHGVAIEALPPAAADWARALALAAEGDGRVDLMLALPARVPQRPDDEPADAGGGLRHLHVRGAWRDRVIAGVISDVTAQQRRRAEAQARAVAELMERERRYVLERLHRELRVPLNTLVAFAQAQAGQAAAPPDGASRRVQLAGTHLLDLVDELLSVQGERGEDEPQLRPVQLEGALQRWVPREVQGPDLSGLPQALAIWADPGALRRLVNLACTAGHGGSGAATAERLSVSLPEPERVRLQVHWPALADDGSRSLRIDVATRLARLQGATLAVDTTAAAPKWTLTFRRARVDQLWPPAAGELVPPPALSPVAPAVEPNPDDPLRVREDVRGYVLYVEDDAFNAELAEQALMQRPQVRLVVAPSADIARLMLAEQRPDLVLLDLVLPGGGESVLAHLRATPALAAVPCVLLSSVTEESIVSALLERGADGYLAKPVPVAELLRTVDRWLRPGERR